MSYRGTVDRLTREVKMCLIGNYAVGKSNLCLRFISDRFDYHHPVTLGASFMSKSIDIGEGTTKLNIWDTSGEERYKSVANIYYRGAAAAILVYDITSKSSFKSLDEWHRLFSQFGNENAIIAIAGHKCDLENQRQVSTAEGRNYARGIGAIFHETSALTGENVNKLFDEIARALPPLYLHQGFHILEPENKNKNQPKRCCK